MNYTVAVRAMCEFTAKRGDLDLRFTPAPSAQEGIVGHGIVTSRRDDGYEREIALAGEHGNVTVRGRADGYDPALNRIEEIKTYRGDLNRMPANHRALHWAQARVYGHLLCKLRDLASLTVAIVYFDVDSQQESVLTETHSAASLRDWFESQCERFAAFAASETAHRAARDAALRVLPFPHGTFRSGQRRLAADVYRAARDGRALLAQAPTGIGKTVGTLFPMLRACGDGHLDRVLFLTAKTPGRALALEALDLLRRAHQAAAPAAGAEPAAGAAVLPLRTLELVARDKACEHPDRACHGESCPLARGFYDRLDAARGAALARLTLDRATVRETALAHQVCPYYLAQELARWADVIVGDYNYYYDGSALLHSLAVQNQWRIGVLVDEAHNLLDRARGMYSATLDQFVLADAKRRASPALAAPLERLNREWNALNRALEQDYVVQAAVPPALLLAAQRFIGRVSELLAELPLSIEPQVLQFAFDAMHFVNLAEQFDTHSIFDITRVAGEAARARGSRGGRAKSVLCVRNVIPADFLAPRHACARATVLFSGTLSPFQFYRDTLGLPDGTPALEVDGPFRASQLEVRVAGHVSTRWRDREGSLAPIVELIAAQYARRPGNYLGFLSSFDYLRRIVALMRERHPEVPVWAQERGMDEAARDAFLARFRDGGRGVGFAVLGGAFAEGIDLAGERLIGAFIATLGLPQINDVNEQMRRALDARFGSGYDYMYLFPGMQKVVQAAGRVIRTEHDEGVVHLIDDRYRRREVQRLLPKWWRIDG
ncbi:ATP-dependent DNA helicase [Burkholderia glumae]|uniref:ATP-dependent DNA helicase n=2 Tax=Burkholderia glumae TaxID=337 RepID=UPI001295BABA|nr:ATP-dependent DNA helicase [Burkholderia glumae]MCM2495605.1 ATP-dependent DNA helicase [Burkholderia glumae]MCM2546616.1 ATP-dependent DNA helicase [Burkholderia glumae]MCM2552288.1 ATP-dependent DNA helicase [Burkholderia glumae]NVE24735.1 ATP-dependent DNA helicase [Burkholderia glumae]QGA40819.1 ATP-dependent DNA helicase [Burkholderia glumae]